MRTRFVDGMVIVLLGLAVFTAAVRALPVPTMQAASVDHAPMVKHMGGTGRTAPRMEAAAP